MAEKDIEDRFVSHVDAIEQLVEECASEDTELGERLRERMDAAGPALDDVQDLLHEHARKSGEEGEGEGSHEESSGDEQ